jgi:hypothetical protein
MPTEFGPAKLLQNRHVKEWEQNKKWTFGKSMEVCKAEVWISIISKSGLLH